MYTKKKEGKTRWLVKILMILCLLLFASKNVNAQKYSLGDIPLDAETYQKHLKSTSLEAVLGSDATDPGDLASAYDARNHGIVTPAKDQGACGSCWAFASTGAMESHILKQYGGNSGIVNLAEQQPLSCNSYNYDCCKGGTSLAILDWQNQGPVNEACFPYYDYRTGCSDTEVPCPDPFPCDQLAYRVEEITYYTVGQSAAEYKVSLFDDGPSYFRFDVYDDFIVGAGSYWNNAGTDAVYTNAAGSRYLGGHAVLLIGWDEGKGAFLCKNSWGAEDGPNGDGTFWIAYSGHVNDLRFQMVNFLLTNVEFPENETGMCDDGLDNDDDDGQLNGGIDCDDAECINSINEGECCSDIEICDDGLDNDCDATIDNNGIDCNDDDCSGHPFCETCKDRGQTCDEDAECCSGKCRGPEGYERCIGRP